MRKIGCGENTGTAGDDEPAALALFDVGHGQPNWAQTGFTSRELGTNCAGLTEMLCRLGLRCESVTAGQLEAKLPRSRLLVIPPPTGRYDERKERWRPERRTLFSPADIASILAFLHSGGRLLAFSYRFGDSFTRSNLSELLLPLGCRLNDAAVLDLEGIRDLPPLRLRFETTRECLPLSWSVANVHLVHWRPMATFTILDDSSVKPLAISPGGRCFCFNRALRQISLESLPVAVAGRHGQGRFAVFGGPHAFETGSIGLLTAADNRAFLKNTLEWLLGDEALAPPDYIQDAPVWDGRSSSTDLFRVLPHGDGARTVANIEKILRRSGILKALSRARCLP